MLEIQAPAKQEHLPAMDLLTWLVFLLRKDICMLAQVGQVRFPIKSFSVFEKNSRQCLQILIQFMRAIFDVGFQPQICALTGNSNNAYKPSRRPGCRLSKKFWLLLCP